MVDKNQILIRYFREGESKRCIASELKIHRKTVSKYIDLHSNMHKKSNGADELSDSLSSKTVYDISSRSKKRLTEDITVLIQSCLRDNAEKRNSGMSKQQKRKIDIHTFLLSKGFVIGYTTVCNYIRTYEKKSRESFIKQLYSPGIVSEFDWGEVKLYISGKQQTLNLAVFTSAFSNHRWAKLFYRQDTLAFSQSHIDYFSFLGGVYREVVYDNMRVVIRKFVGYKEKEPTVALLELSNYYKFGFRFCNVRKGNEKGHVERSVEYVRRKSFNDLVEFSSIASANSHLIKVIEQLNNMPQQLTGGKTANIIFEDEKPHLYPISSAYKCFQDINSKVNNYSTVIVLCNKYSVPDHLVGKIVNIRLFAERLDIYFDKKLVCSHLRSYGAHTWTVDIEHYLTTLSRKPGALKGSIALSQCCENVKSVYNNYFSSASRDFIELLQYCKEKKIEFSEVEKSIARLKNISPTTISKDMILSLLSKSDEPDVKQDTSCEIYLNSQSILNDLTVFCNKKE